jgi:eukaryotic-like serine/threonine-protein kinase
MNESILIRGSDGKSACQPFATTALMTFDSGKGDADGVTSELGRRYQTMVGGPSVSWTSHYRLLRQLGRGGQGIVFLAERLAAYGISMPVALKFFSPDSYASIENYRCDMERLARLAGVLVHVQDHHLLNVQNVVDCDGINVMVTEFVDGVDLGRLTQSDIASRTRDRCSPAEYDRFKQIMFDEVDQLALKPGIAVAILRNCLGAVAAMHRVGIIHGDLKPSNVMLERSGTAKVVDFGSATEIGEVAPFRKWTPRYAAVEVMLGRSWTFAADLCSLGYVLVELLSGKPLFANVDHYPDLISAKRELPSQLESLLPGEIVGNALLMKLILGLIAPKPSHRFSSAEAADLSETGAAAFHRQLVHGNLSCEYQHDLRLWLEALGDIPAAPNPLASATSTMMVAGSVSLS